MTKSLKRIPCNSNDNKVRTNKHGTQRFI